MHAINAFATWKREFGLVFFFWGGFGRGRRDVKKFPSLVLEFGFKTEYHPVNVIRCYHVGFVEVFLDLGTIVDFKLDKFRALIPVPHNFKVPFYQLSNANKLHKFPQSGGRDGRGIFDDIKGFVRRSSPLEPGRTENGFTKTSGNFGGIVLPIHYEPLNSRLTSRFWILVNGSVNFLEVC
jgi:hypothetical protein